MKNSFFDFLFSVDYSMKITFSILSHSTDNIYVHKYVHTYIRSAYIYICIYIIYEHPNHNCKIVRGEQLNAGNFFSFEIHSLELAFDFKRMYVCVYIIHISNIYIIHIKH